MIHLSPDEMGLVRKILKVFVPERRVAVFGSRATGARLKPHSDLDLCIMGDIALDSATMSDLRAVFSGSRLPMRVDLVDWAATAPHFRAIIEKDAVEIQPAVKSP